MIKSFISNGTTYKTHILYDVFTGKNTAHLLSSEFSNCHGMGKTIEESITSLKIRINQLKNK